MDVMEFEILEDGTISVKTSEISEANHLKADEILDEIESALGGERTTEQLQHEFWNNRKVIRTEKGVKIVNK